MVRIKNFVFFISCIFVASCSGQAKNITVDSSERFYSYSIGQGETIHVGRADFDFEDSLLQQVPVNVVYESPVLESVYLEDGSVLGDEKLKIEQGSFFFDFSVTCVNPFKEPISINYIKYYFGKSNIHLDLKYNVKLSFNGNYSTNPCFPGESANQFALDDHTFFLLLRKHDLKLSSADSFVVDSFVSGDPMLNLTDKKWAPYTPYIRTDDGVRIETFTALYDKLDYKVFSPVDLKDYSDYSVTDGIVLKFNLVIDTDVDSFGTDVMFNIALNGDGYSIPYHLQYNALATNS
jgi:hypothetical protein